MGRAEGDGEREKKILNVLFSFVGKSKVGRAVAKHVTDIFSSQIRGVQEVSVDR